MNKKLGKFILAALIVLLLVGCTPDPRFYDGNHPELYVVATHSLLGVSGGLREDTLILEEDAFGRVMFAYIGGTRATNAANINDSILAILIAQKTTEYHSYFYSGINYILLEMTKRYRRMPESASVFFNEDFVMGYFTAEQIEQLKLANSWNKELNEDRFFRVPVSRHYKARYMTYVSEEKQQETYRAVARGGQLGHPSQSTPLTMDKNGNVLFFMRGSRHDRELQMRIHYPTFLFMFDAEGNLIEDTGVMELTDLWDYREQLRGFKEANGWSFYYR